MFGRGCLRIASCSNSFNFRQLCRHNKISFCLTCKNKFNPNRLILGCTKIQASTIMNSSNLMTLEVMKPKKSTLTESYKSLTSEELLEKLIASVSTDLHQKNRVYKNNIVKIINKIKELNFSTKKQGLLLLKCCTELLPDETAVNRLALAEEIWTALKPHTTFQIEHYNELLRVYIANNRTVNATNFIKQMSPVKPNNTTYELLLEALGEAGDINQATEVIANMKSQGIPASEVIFNSLIVCQGKHGNPENCQEILSMMESIKLPPSIDTFTSLARAYAFNGNNDDVLKSMDKALASELKFGEKQVMDIVKTVALNNGTTILPLVLKYLPEETLGSPSISPLMQSVATQLVFLNQPIAALELYKCLPLPSFGPKDDSGLHGRSLVRDCVKASMPVAILALITQELMSSGRNPIALQNACEASLQLGKVPMALDIFMRMKQLGMPVRPHYFWPIFIHSSRSCGEKGIMDTIHHMMAMDVTLDYDTMIDYVLPHVSFTSPQTLMKKFTDTGVQVSCVLTPVMETLLKMGQIRAASEIGELFQAKIDAEKLLKPLINAYLTSLDVTSTIYILEDISAKASAKDKDWVGRCLCEFIQHKKIRGDISDFHRLIQELKNKNMKISTTAADFCVSRIPDKYPSDTTAQIRNILIEITDDRLIDEAEMFTHQIPHPRQMNEESLKAHLNELEAKGMNTRGVLRKLLQKYCSEGNLQAARETVSRCQKEGVYLSAGMKASIFDLHVKMGELELAELSLEDLNKNSPNFVLDEFKVIDFATLMVYRKQIDKAMALIEEQSKKRRVMGGRKIEMNCWRLLDATSANGSHIETRKMFQLLTSFGYCKPTNSLLGPLIRVHLKNENIHEAVKEFTALTAKYNKTPLKHELLCKILQLMSDGHTEDNFVNNEKADGRLNKLAHAVLDADKRVHGAGDVPLTLIAALADVGYKKTLRKILLDPTMKFHPEALMRRCERFADEKKIEALLLIAECASDRRNVNVTSIYELALSVYQRDDNTKHALELWQKMQELDVTPSQKFIRQLCALLKANKKPIPGELVTLLGPETKSLVSN